MLAPKYGNTAKAKAFRKRLYDAQTRLHNLWDPQCFDRHMARQHSLYNLQREKYYRLKKGGNKNG